jgi:amino acid adenylation domain-containing protein
VDPDAVIAVYGILKAGAVYVPLDDQAPAARIAYIANDTDMRVVLRDLDGIDAYPATPPTIERDADDLAYILYTSGSTGTPKGVTLSHRNALAFVLWAAEEVGIGADDRLSSHAPLNFDLSVFDLFATAATGATLVLVPRDASVFPIELARLIRDEQISVWYSVPSILTLLTMRGGLDLNPLPALRTVIFAGEVFPTKYLRALMELLPGARFLNFYGPTETNVCTWYEVPRPAPDPLPIGRPIAGVDIDVVEEELHVSGPTVMHGYWGDAEKTAGVLSEHGGVRTYRTGDFVQWNGDGNLRFLGRRDSQVKSRGYRIELGEVERALSAHERVTECAVLAVPDELMTNRLRAIVAPSGDLTVAELVAFCEERLPRYMIPTEFELRDALPKTTTGKIDRALLARP